MIERILLIEDEEGQRLLMRRLLDGAFGVNHVEMDEAKTWQEAEGMLSVIAYDVVILDLNLQPDSPLDRTVDLITDIAKRWPPIVVVTGYGNYEIRKRCIDNGAAYFIQKGEHLIGVFNACLNVYLLRLRDGSPKT